MNNERYLFRGKPKGGEWIYGDLLWNNGVPIIVMQVDRTYIGTSDTGQGKHWHIETPAYKVDSETVGQWSGLIDSKGVKIFEGDQLFVCAGYSSFVKFEDGMFVSVYSHPEDGETLPLSEVIGKDTEVIFDNDKAKEEWSKEKACSSYCKAK